MISRRYTRLKVAQIEPQSMAQNPAAQSASPERVRRLNSVTSVPRLPLWRGNGVAYSSQPRPSAAREPSLHRKNRSESSRRPSSLVSTGQSTNQAPTGSSSSARPSMHSLGGPQTRW